MADRVVRVTHKSWGQRVASSVGGAVVGLVLFVGSFPLLWWNEGRSIKTYKSLNEGAAAVASVSAEQVDPGNDGKLVHVSGKATTNETLSDPDFGVAALAIRLERRVSMYQWTESSKSETRKKLGGGEETVTTYSYSKEWRDDVVDSSDFEEPAGHENPSRMDYPGTRWQAAGVTLGAFSLSDSLKGKIDKPELVAVDASTLPALRERLGRKPWIQGSGLYLGENPGQPAIGDLNVSFYKTAPTEVSLVARQSATGFVPWTSSNGREIELLTLGTVPASSMFDAAQRENTFFTWLLRGGGFLLMAIGLAMFSGPLAVVADLIPFVGSVVRAGTGLVAFLIAVPLSAGTIGIAWFFYRPLVAIPLLVAAGAVSFGVGKLVAKRRAAALATAGSAGT